MKSFHNATAINNPIEAKAGLDKGSTILQNIPKGEQPSNSAASYSVLGIVCPIVIAGAVITSTIILCCKYKDKIEEFLDDHPVIDKIVTGVKVVGAVALGIVAAPIVATCMIVKKVWEGIKSFGSWLGGLFGI